MCPTGNFFFKVMVYSLTKPNNTYSHNLNVHLSRIRSLDRPARSQSLYRLSYPLLWLFVWTSCVRARNVTHYAFWKLTTSSPSTQLCPVQHSVQPYHTKVHSSNKRQQPIPHTEFGMWMESFYFDHKGPTEADRTLNYVSRATDSSRHVE
jgi:hypothetical protein